MQGSTGGQGQKMGVRKTYFESRLSLFYPGGSSRADSRTIPPPGPVKGIKQNTFGGWIDSSFHKTTDMDHNR